MPGLVINGREVQVPGVRIRNFKDEPKLALRVGLPEGGNDGKKRTLPVTLVVLHTTKGIPGGSDPREQVIKPGLGPDTRAEDRTASYWSTDPKASGAHIVVDHDGSVGCLADLATVCAYHAGQSEVNNRSVGIEIFQGSGAEMYELQLDIVRKVVDVITIEFGIQRQIPKAYLKKPTPRLDDDGGKDVMGVVGHRDTSDQRGKGDPGDAIFDVLAKHGYERMDLWTNEDRAVWKKRQEQVSHALGRHIAADGIPGPMTRAALKELGYQHGLWAMPPEPVKEKSPIETILEGFMPTLVLAFGSREKAIAVIAEWVKGQTADS